MISFNSNLDGFLLPSPPLLKSWINNVISSEKKKTGQINYTFLTDEELLEINKSFLQHNFYTDIITFPTSNSEEIISGDIFISIDRVKENAESNNVTFDNELKRVIVHGVLHLLGYDDHTDNEKIIMRRKEDYYINLF